MIVTGSTRIVYGTGHIEHAREDQIALEGEGRYEEEKGRNEKRACGAVRSL